MIQNAPRAAAVASSFAVIATAIITAHRGRPVTPIFSAMIIARRKRSLLERSQIGRHGDSQSALQEGEFGD